VLVSETRSWREINCNIIIEPAINGDIEQQRNEPRLFLCRCERGPRSLLIIASRKSRTTSSTLPLADLELDQCPANGHSFVHGVNIKSDKVQLEGTLSYPNPYPASTWSRVQAEQVSSSPTLSFRFHEKPEREDEKLEPAVLEERKVQGKALREVFSRTRIDECSSFLRFAIIDSG